LSNIQPTLQVNLSISLNLFRENLDLLSNQPLSGSVQQETTAG